MPPVRRPLRPSRSSSGTPASSNSLPTMRHLQRSVARYDERDVRTGKNKEAGSKAVAIRYDDGRGWLICFIGCKQNFSRKKRTACRYPLRYDKTNPPPVRLSRSVCNSSSGHGVSRIYFTSLFYDLFCSRSFSPAARLSDTSACCGRFPNNRRFGPPNCLRKRARSVSIRFWIRKPGKLPFASAPLIWIPASSDLSIFYRHRCTAPIPA